MRGKTWWASWQAFGKREARSTGIKVGEKGSKGKAQELLDKWVAPYKAEDEAGTLAILVEKRDKAKAKAEEAMAVIRAEEARIPLAEAWERHPYTKSQKTRGRTTVHPLSPRNVRENQDAWWRFVDWARETYGAGHAMQDVTEEWAKRYARHLEKQGLTASRYNFLILVCKVMYRIAGVSPCPFDAVDRMKQQKPQHREPFTREQVARLLDAVENFKWDVPPTEWRGFLAVLYYTGLRAGDGALLTHATRRKGKIKTELLKTGEEVELDEHPALTQILSVCVESHPASRNDYLFPGLAKLYKTKGAHAISRRFEEYMAWALGETVVDEDGTETFIPFDGREDRKNGKRRISRYGLHSLRHTLAAASAQAGVPIGTTQRWLGHSSPTVTRIYTDHEDEEQRRRLIAAIALDAPAEARPALPPATNAPEVLRRILEALRDMNGKNWKRVRDELVGEVEKELGEEEQA